MVEKGQTQPGEARPEEGRSAYVCHILTIFPDFFDSPLRTSIMGRAIEAGHLDVRCHDIREAASDKHRTTDDTPYGGGAGMVMKPGPIVRTLEAVEASAGRLHRIFLTPQGRPLTQATAARLADLENGMLLVCGRYEGVDERVREHFIDEEISIGDYVLTGGEPAALILLETVARLIPGVLGNAASARKESFQSPLLEHPQYTRPADFRGWTVPDILTCGDHGRIAAWRRRQSLLRTLERRPDLLPELWSSLTDSERTFVQERAPQALRYQSSHRAGPNDAARETRS